MARKKLIESQCPHCESNLLIKVSLNEETKEMETEVSVTKAGKKVIDPNEPEPKKKGDSLDDWLFGKDE